MESYDRLVEKWAPVLNEETSGKIADSHRRSVTAAVLENQEKAMREQGMMNEVAANAAGEGSRAGTGNATGAADNWNPVLIALVRRAMPNLMAYDVCGVQPMTGPTGLDLCNASCLSDRTCWRWCCRYRSFVQRSTNSVFW